MSDSKSNKSVARTRNYATIVYPESVAPNWKEILSDQKVPCFISPLHDQDVNPDGEPKKPHYHIQYCFEGPKAREQVQKLVDEIGGVGCEVINSQRGYARYLCHLDNPEKFQYSVEDVQTLCGADYLSAIDLPTDKYKAVREMLQWCIDNRTTCFADLSFYAMSYRQDWFRILNDTSTLYIDKTLKSLEWKLGRASNPDDDRWSYMLASLPCSQERSD